MYFIQLKDKISASCASLQRHCSSKIISLACFLYIRILDTNINLFLGYTVWGAYKNQNSEYEICCSKDNIDLRILSKKLIIASGSFEKPFFVNGWHLTNVFTTGGTQILVNSQKILPGTKIIICGNGPLNFQLADELKKGGATVEAVVESSKNPFINFFFVCERSPYKFAQLPFFAKNNHLKIHICKTIRNS